MRRELFLPLVLLWGVGGCVDDLDRKQSQVRQDFGRTCQLFAGVSEAQAKASDELAAQKFNNQKAAIEREFKAFLERHTDESGNLVSRDPQTNEIKPMPVAQLILELDKKQTQMLDLAMAQKNWETQAAKYRDALATFKATVVQLQQQEVDVQAAKESAQAALEKTLGVIGGLAAGAGIGAAVIP